MSRKATVIGATNIILGGKSIIQKGALRPFTNQHLPLTYCLGAILRGDLRRSTAGQHVVISMGRYCLVDQNTVIRPPGKIYKECVGRGHREGRQAELM